MATASVSTPSIMREPPKRILDKWNSWRHWTFFWTCVYLITGALLSATATLVAANQDTGHDGKGFLPHGLAIGLACSSAVLTFVVNALSAQAKAVAFETAGRELEKAIAVYATSQTVTEESLGDAEKRGVDILNSMKPQ